MGRGRRGGRTFVNLVLVKAAGRLYFSDAVRAARQEARFRLWEGARVEGGDEASACGRRRDAARETCDPRLYLPRRERADWAAVPPAIVVTGHFDPVADEGDLYARHLHAKGVAVHAARRLEAHVQFAPSTLAWIHGALRALLDGSDVPPCC